MDIRASSAHFEQIINDIVCVICLIEFYLMFFSFYKDNNKYVYKQEKLIKIFLTSCYNLIFISMTKIKGTSLLLLFTLFLALSSFAQDSKKVYISGVENKIKIGKFTGNRNFAFGVKNIFQEILQDKDFSIVEEQSQADLVFSAEILYFDVNRTKRNISVFHSDVEETLVVIKGLLTDNNGKKIKESVAEESSSEISTSTLITDEGSGKVNQQALSSAIKKTCESLINKIFFNKK